MTLFRDASNLRWLSEDAYIKEIGDIRAELGEIEKVYEDYETLMAMVERIARQVPHNKEQIDKAITYLNRGMKILRDVERSLRELTQTAKAPRRAPIPQLGLTGNIRRDLVRVSDNFARIAVRMRNVGQSLYDVTRIDVDSIRKRLESAYQIARRGFVMFDRAVEAQID